MHTNKAVGTGPEGFVAHSIAGTHAHTKLVQAREMRWAQRAYSAVLAHKPKITHTYEAIRGIEVHVKKPCFPFV